MTSILAKLHPRAFFLDTWRAIDADAATSRDAAYDPRPLWAFVTAAVSLTVIRYIGQNAALYGIYEASTPDGALSFLSAPVAALRSSMWRDLAPLAWWTFWRLVGYFVIPALVVRYAFRAKLSAYNVRVSGLRDNLALYSLFIVVMLIVVVVISFQSDFTDYYPFYKLAGRSWLDLLLWEALYFLQFLSLEFFFRGFLLEACRNTFGSQAIFAAMLPYVMVHFGKPWPECIAAAFAGILLGTLAMKTRSIAGGLLVHECVAISMDVASLIQGDGLPSSITP